MTRPDPWSITPRLARSLTVWCLLTNGIACLGMATVLAPASPLTADPASRMAAIASAGAWYTAVWITWMLAAVSLIGFLFALTASLGAPPLAILGLLLATIGLAPDLIAEAIAISVLPRLAAAGPSREAVGAFVLWESFHVVLTGLLGNGLYTLGGLLINLAAVGHERFPRALARGGLVVWSLGLGLAAVTPSGEGWLMALMVGLTMASFLAWCAAVGLAWFANDPRSARRPTSGPRH